MLALARGEGQSIIIDGNIEVKIVKWSRSSVRLAIQAPREVAVDRDEIWRKMHPGQMTPLEKAELERRERFAREGGGVAVHPAGEGAPHADAPQVPIAAPVEGIYYASAGPGGNRYVTVGSSVEETTVVASIKSGEQVTDIRAGMKGTVAALPVSAGQHVAAGQTLVLIAPA
jgi:carbon storage regulator CsrA